MKKTAIVLALATMFAPSMTRAQVEIDMGAITCADYLAMTPGMEKVFSAWMSGWFNQKKGYTTVDLDAYARNVANVKKWCASNPKDSVMGGLQAATGGAK
ncbi:HdeA/HdeB family chaperone [Rhodoblastus sp. 17X3]|uniref:HdeA/HdeB family chaperone n=1 Tax=Rhodoblastus sp. 17X3 TaxID=3047026 RepID=UPI0024B78CD6|nr:HdeA/HdeB family chaperone [Rhodoblastus sp. 17X3]MDI9848464.1 HdeA/HdeB family chaperone [Rhodoblastus sp. 17X3]